MLGFSVSPSCVSCDCALAHVLQGFHGCSAFLFLFPFLASVLKPPLRAHYCFGSPNSVCLSACVTQMVSHRPGEFLGVLNTFCVFFKVLFSMAIEWGLKQKKKKTPFFFSLDGWTLFQPDQKYSFPLEFACPLSPSQPRNLFAGHVWYTWLCPQCAVFWSVRIFGLMAR